MWVLATSLLSVSGAAEPARPDLSGTWTLAPRPASPTPPTRGDRGSGWGSTLAVTQDADHLAVEYAFFTPAELQPPMRFAFAFDGSETRTVAWMGHGPLDLRSHARWDGDRLVLVTTYPVVDPATHATLSVDVTRTLSLTSPGTLTIETVCPGVLGGRETTTIATYTRP